MERLTRSCVTGNHCNCSIAGIFQHYFTKYNTHIKWTMYIVMHRAVVLNDFFGFFVLMMVAHWLRWATETTTNDPFNHIANYSIVCTVLFVWSAKFSTFYKWDLLSKLYSYTKNRHIIPDIHFSCNTHDLCLHLWYGDCVAGRKMRRKKEKKKHSHPNKYIKRQ